MVDGLQLIPQLHRFSMVKSADVLPKGHVRIETGFLYPDGSSVDVFVVHEEDRPLLPATRLSDLGQTMEFLLHHDVKPWSTAKRRQQLEDAISLYGVTLAGGALERPLENLTDSLEQGIILLGQACVRMADLLFTKRLQLQSVFTEDVEDFLGDSDLPFKTAAELPGLFGDVPIDFLVSGATTTSAVLTLFSRMPSAAHVSANEVFRRFYDLHAAQRSEQRVALIDDTVDVSRVYKDEDLQRIAVYSTVVPFSDRESTRTLLAA